MQLIQALPVGDDPEGTTLFGRKMPALVRMLELFNHIPRKWAAACQNRRICRAYGKRGGCSWCPVSQFWGLGADGPEDRGLSERCLIGFNAGPPFTGGGYNANVQIFQNKDHAVIMTEMVHDARIVPLVDRAELDDNIRLWSEIPGYWDEETLVVLTKNFSDLTPSFSRFGNSKQKLTERFTRVGKHIEYEWTLGPFTFPIKLLPLCR